MEEYQYKDVIKLIKSAITGEKEKLSKSFCLEKCVDLIKDHSVYSLVFTGASNCGVSMDDVMMKKLFGSYCQNLFYHEHQIEELERILKEFENNKINYMPLKGYNLKKIYPLPELRVMGDADILIQEKQYPKIKQIMLELGFEYKLEGDHDYTWISKDLYLELHYTLLNNYNKKFDDYFGDGWKLARKTDFSNYRYEMKHEDEFIYLFIHYMKHYLNGGVGCRHIIDLWVYCRHYKDMNFQYIEKIIKDLDMFEFYNNTIKTINVWFNNEISNNITDIMTQFIFDSGLWGTMERSMLARAVKATQSEGNVYKGKIHVVVTAFFPSIDKMKHKYTILKRFVFLLPVVWIYRWFDILFIRRDSLLMCKKKMEVVCKGNLSEYEQNLNTVGLNYSFIENKK